jgi:ABC-2 type transport system permease protein
VHVARKALRDVRGLAIGGGLAVFAIVFLHAAIYPEYGEQSGIEYPEALKGIFGEAGTILSPEGYTTAYLSNILVFVAILAVIAGSAATAGEEGAGTLDLLLAQPVTRVRLLAGKAAGIAFGLALVSAASVPAYMLGQIFADNRISPGRFAEAILTSFPVAILFLAFALWAGASLSSRAAAATLGGGLAVVAYLLNLLGAAVGFLHGPRRLSPFYWGDASHVFFHGFDWVRAGGMLGVAALFFLLSAGAFARRDIASGKRESTLWRLGRRAGAARPGELRMTRFEGKFAGRLGLSRKAFGDVRTALLSCSAVTFLTAVMDVAIYPWYRDALKDFEYPDALKGMLGEAGSIVTPEGFLASEYFSLVPLLLVTVAIIAGTGATAGEEGAGTLDLLLAQPVTRRRLLASKAAGIAFGLTLAALAGIPGFVLTRMLVDFAIPVSHFVAAILNMLLLALLYFALALWAGATLPNRTAAVMLTAGAVVAGFLLTTLTAAVDWLGTPRKLSPFYWSDASHVLIRGFDPARSLPLALSTLAFLILAFVSFERRDIAAGRREWSMRWLKRRRAVHTPVGTR